jgi:hypothetical protein
LTFVSCTRSAAHVAAELFSLFLRPLNKKIKIWTKKKFNFFRKVMREHDALVMPMMAAMSRRMWKMQGG